MRRPIDHLAKILPHQPGALQSLRARVSILRPDLYLRPDSLSRRCSAGRVASSPPNPQAGPRPRPTATL